MLSAPDLPPLVRRKILEYEWTGHTGTAAGGRMSSRAMYPQPWDGLIGNAINDAHLAADERRSWAAIGMLLSPTDASTLRRLLRRRRCHRHGFGCRGGGWSGR